MNYLHTQSVKQQRGPRFGQIQKLRLINCNKIIIIIAAF